MYKYALWVILQPYTGSLNVVVIIRVKVFPSCKILNTPQYTNSTMINIACFQFLFILTYPFVSIVDHLY